MNKKTVVVLLLLSCFVEPTHTYIYVIYIYIYIYTYTITRFINKRKEHGIYCTNYLSHSTKDLHYFINKNLFSNYIFSFFLSFFSLIHYNQILCSLLYRSYIILHTHSQRREMIQFCINSTEDKRMRKTMTTSYLCCFLLFFVTPTNTQARDPFWQEKREVRIVHCTYDTIQYITEEVHYFIAKSILIMPISFSFFLFSLYFKTIRRQLTCDCFLLFHFTSYSTTQKQEIHQQVKRKRRSRL